jgi:hypothetical protein
MYQQNWLTAITGLQTAGSDRYDYLELLGLTSLAP